METFETEPTLILMGVQVGTVNAETTEGTDQCLLLRLVGTTDGRTPAAVQRFAIHSEDVAAFLTIVNDTAREHFPDHVPPTVCPNCEE